MLLQRLKKEQEITKLRGGKKKDLFFFHFIVCETFQWRRIRPWKGLPDLRFSSSMISSGSDQNRPWKQGWKNCIRQVSQLNQSSKKVIAYLSSLLLRCAPYSSMTSKTKLTILHESPSISQRKISKAVYSAPNVLHCRLLQSPFTGYQENFARCNQYNFWKSARKHHSLLIRLGISGSYHDSFNVLQPQNMFQTLTEPHNVQSAHWISVLLPRHW